MGHPHTINMPKSNATTSIKVRADVERVPNVTPSLELGHQTSDGALRSQQKHKNSCKKSQINRWHQPNRKGFHFYFVRWTKRQSVCAAQFNVHKDLFCRRICFRIVKQAICQSNVQRSNVSRWYAVNDGDFVCDRKLFSFTTARTQTIDNFLLFHQTQKIYLPITK